MPHTIDATKARIHLGEVLRQVSEEETPVVIERTGQAGVIAISQGEYDRLGSRSELAEWLAEVDLLRAKYGTTRMIQPLPDIDEMIDAGRDEWLDDLIDSLH